MIHRYASLIANPPLDVNYNEHRVRIDNWALEGMSVMLVAHSQGNLFANAAYNYAVSQIGTGAVKVVHVAPASVITNGEHVDRKSTRLNSSHVRISYAVFCLKKKKNNKEYTTSYT